MHRCPASPSATPLLRDYKEERGCPSSSRGSSLCVPSSPTLAPPTRLPLLPPFLLGTALSATLRHNMGMAAEKKEGPSDTDTILTIDADEGKDKDPEEVNSSDEQEEHRTTPVDPEECKVDTLFYRICWFCFMLGVNFYKSRPWYLRVLSGIIVFVFFSINVYFILYLGYQTIHQPFNPDTIATSLGLITSSLQATLSTLFLAYWQYKGIPCRVLRQLYAAQKGVGIGRYRHELRCIVRSFYFVIFVIFAYITGLIIANQMEVELNFLDRSLKKMFGVTHCTLILHVATLYTMLCWAVALFIFSLLVHATNYEFRYYNDQVRSIKSTSCGSDEELCNRLIELIKVHNALTDCVKRLDLMFHRYAFVMIATIIPTTIFALFMIFRKADAPVQDLLFSAPLIFFCIFSFYTLTNSPSKLHDTIYSTKSALCSNTHIWFPYRPNVYHSALAFVCHLDQANLGISIWGFAVVSKPLVLTTLSVMVTCLALFLQVGECRNGVTF